MLQHSKAQQRRSTLDMGVKHNAQKYHDGDASVLLLRLCSCSLELSCHLGLLVIAPTAA